MNIEMIKPSVERIVENDPLKKIEIAARTCYKSEANITDDSSVKMIKQANDIKKSERGIIADVNDQITDA